MSDQVTLAARAGAQRSRIEVVSPAKETVVGGVSADSLSEVTAIAAELRAAQPEWEARGPRARLTPRMTSSGSGP